MGRGVVAALAALLFAGFAAASSAASDPAATARSEVIALGDAWIRAEIAQDRPALERILHKGFLSTFDTGRTVDRAAYIANIMEADISPFRVKHEAVRVDGDTAVVIDRVEGGGTKFTWIAIRRGGLWQVISQTFSPMQAP